jgi:hypothetical protein
MPSPLEGLELSRPMPPDLLSPPMNSLPPRLCPTVRGVVGVDGCGDGGPEMLAEGLAAGLRPEGLKENSGSALMDIRWPDILFALLMPCTERGHRGVDEELSGPFDAFSAFGSRMGKTKSGFGSNSTGALTAPW